MIVLSAECVLYRGKSAFHRFIITPINQTAPPAAVYGDQDIWILGPSRPHLAYQVQRKCRAIIPRIKQDLGSCFVSMEGILLQKQRFINSIS